MYGIFMDMNRIKILLLPFEQNDEHSYCERLTMSCKIDLPFKTAFPAFWLYSRLTRLSVPQERGDEVTRECIVSIWLEILCLTVMLLLLFDRGRFFSDLISDCMPPIWSGLASGII